MADQPPMGHSSSVEAQDPHNEVTKKTKSRRPANTAFRQQRLKAWQPILTPKTVLPLLFAVGIIFAPVGGLLIWASSQVQELVIDYSDCATDAPSGNDAGDFETITAGKVTSSFKSSKATATLWRRNETVYSPAPGVNITTTVCSLQFDIPNDIEGPILLYYRLTNFFQNHRRYVKSLDTDQLSGTASSNGTIKKSSCDPLTTNDEGKAYYPCGLIANSLFNDTFHSPVLVNAKNSSDGSQVFPMTNKGIAWSSDKELYGKTAYTWDQVVPPPNWQKRYPDNYTADNPPPNLHEDEAFMVWMRTAGLPTFSKLALRNDNETMAAGTYQLDIYDYFPVNEYGGTKSVVFSTRTVMGGKNPFLGIAYCVVGGICILLGALFTVAHLVKPRKLGDHTYLTWNNEPSTATTTGRDARPGTGRT